MRWRIFGAILLIVSIVLVGLMMNKTQTSVKYDTLADDKNVQVSWVYAEEDFVGPLPLIRNITINPFNLTPNTVNVANPLGVPSNTSYTVNVVVTSSAWNVTPIEPAPIDLWVVNRTGLGLVYSYLENGTYLGILNETQDYLPKVKAYSNSIDKSLIIKYVQWMDYVGNYTVMLINAYQDIKANVTMAIEDTIATYATIFPVNVASQLFTAIVAVVGVVMVVRPKKANPSRKRLDKTPSKKRMNK